MWLSCGMKFIHIQEGKGLPMQEPGTRVVTEEPEGRVSAVNCAWIKPRTRYKGEQRTRLDVTSSRVDVVGRDSVGLQNDVKVVAVHCVVISSRGFGRKEGERTMEGVGSAAWNRDIDDGVRFQDDPVDDLDS
jgi:hypothetical protein